MQSLYHMCLDMICFEFAAIDKRIVKDLPKHILEQILCKLNPFYLEDLENEEFLIQRGILTDSLWKVHFASRFTNATARSCSSSEHYNYKSWRAHYFARHFRMLIHPMNLSSDKIKEKHFQDDLNKELYKPPQETSCKLVNIASPDLNDVINLCLKHLTRVGVHHNATCAYLARHRDVLTKLASVLQHLVVGQLRDDSVEDLINILSVLLKNQLRSFSLSNCKVENVENLRGLFRTLAESQLLGTQRSTQLSAELKESTISLDSEVCSVGAGFVKEYKEEEPTNLKSGSSCNDFEMVDNKAICSSSTPDNGSCNKGKDMRNDSLHNKLDVNKEGNIINSLYNMFSDENFIKEDDEEKPVDDINCLKTEDELYEDIFSRRTASQETWLDSHAASTRQESSPVRKLRQTEPNLERTSNHVRPHCFTELKLSSCLMNNASLKVFSEELIFFRSLRSLALCEVGSCYFPALNDLITNIQELVIHGSLRHLVFDNKLAHDRHFDMFCDMLILFCERCQSTQTRKGLWSLHIENALVSSLDRLGEVLRTCSFCEEPVTALNTARATLFNTKDDSFYSACKCCALKSRGYTESFSNNLVCNVPVVCKQGKSETKVKPDDQHVLVNSIQNNSVRKTDPMSHQYITTGIENLYISFSINQLSATVLASSLLRNRSLRRISLPSCCLKTDDISYIFDCISGCDFHECNTVLEKLDLRDNLFETIQNNSLCNLITRSHLVHLDLSYCGLEDIPDDVVLALSSNKFLKVFKIAGNRLGDTGVNQLSKVFASAKKISVLNTLDLSCNRLNSSSLLDFGNVLTTWPVKLREICITGNPRVDHSIVRKCLEEFFDVVIIDPYVDGGYMAYADYLSEM